MSKLSEHQQFLIESFYDGEAGFINRFRARRMLRRSEEANSYYQSLIDFNSEIKSFDKELVGNDDSEQAWQALEARLIQEERAAVLLGERTVRDESSSFWDRFSFDIFGPFGAGVGSAVAVTGALVFAFIPLGDLNNGIGNNGASSLVASSSSSPEFNRVNLAESEWVGAQPVELVSTMVKPQGNTPLTRVAPQFYYDEPLTIASRPQVPQVQMASTNARRAPRVNAPTMNGPMVEVDWMKSDGRVRMIHSPSAKAPILWVRKRAPQGARR